ncbi:FAD-dependent monooxygenase [Phaeovulum vinaykumarii]|uniref:2-octaprenyl-6-methoxyphenol hydroxylase /2-octaprenyl-3-methyl-6-methoxy-1,4-benzoquinol hydroxylase n=1 Tax=Phaeovulum vinaykumarii TaxID=407234 RepID=A0A1N7KQ76_9RHOB|nr:FAD-dependent monooxygenase [Phaeovulum vinaykumarii]SIS63646.1 2-octaprenyl-6-methoxyphenol hydroxylase /2-octaprenyl-3-methyl-6-methoxy-1,4-benzoquinol hydroxylase [Phaeovulum vinaykumarii]SOC01852.1 2-octaprenyl-6-methoxyphenol hydroxylase /2-octaprenyl-3-methyl-6-methoxy-1,4-benzoquinol hydroxylase [Phaeovulum vinaykumarii]
MEQDFDVVIAGGGLVGPALGLALAGAGLQVAVVDPAPRAERAEEGFDGRAYALAAGSQRMLAALGLWDDLAPESQPILKVVAADGRAGEGCAPWPLRFDAAEMEGGPLGFMLEDRFLYAALRGAMDRLTLIAGVAVNSQHETPAGIEVGLSDGRMLRARLLVGADGRRSGVAVRAGITRSGHDYGQTALVAAIAHERPHEGTAYQMFMSTGPLAILPLTGNRSSVVWSERSAAADAIAKLGDADFLGLLAPRFGDFLGEISLCGPRFSYPLGLTLADSYVAPRVALVGDAAHGVHPIAGQGLNMGLRDVAALAEVLVRARRLGMDIGRFEVLEQYQQWRRFDATTMGLGMDAVNRLFSNDNPILRAARDVGMGLVGAVGPLRRAFAREAAGTAGALPRLMRGQAL